MGWRNGTFASVLLVAFGAALWGTDAVLRVPLLEEMSPPALVLSEHLVLLLYSVPAVVLGWRFFGLLGPAQWIASVAPEPDEGPDAEWFVERFRQSAGTELSYPAVQAFAAGILCARCLRDGGAEDAAQLEAARQLECTTLYGGFRLDPESGLQVGHEVLIVQWQDGVRRVVWPPERAECSLLYPLPG